MWKTCVGRRLVGRLRDEASGDGGFTLVELAVALVVLGLAMIMLTTAITNNLRGLLVAKRREVATAAVQEWLETARTLAWGDLGLVASDATVNTDPEIVTAGGVKWFGAGCETSTQPCEPVRFATNSSGHPFNPHVTAPFIRGSTSLTRSVYVTGIDRNGDGVTDVKRVTVRVLWTNVGSPPVSNSVRASTLVSVTTHGGSSNPIVGAFDVRKGNATMRISLDGTAVDEMRHALPFAKGEAVNLSPPSPVGCAARSDFAEHTAASSFGGAPVTTLADDDPLSGNTTSQGPTTNSFSGTPIPGDIVPWVAQSSMPGTSTCTSIVQDGTHALPYVDGKASGPSLLTFRKDVGSVSSYLGTVTTLSVADNDTATDDVSGSATTTSSGSVRIVAAQAAARYGDIKSVAWSQVPNGLLWVRPMTISASATGQSSGTPASSPSVTSASSEIRLYDPAGTGSSCGGTVSGGYRVLTRSATGALSCSLTHPGLLLGVGSYLSYTVTVQTTAATQSSPPASPTPASTTTWKAHLQPLTAQVVGCVVSVPGPCSTTAEPLLSVGLDLGSVLAQVALGLSR